MSVRLELRDLADGKLVPYTGAVGSIWFDCGVSREEHEPEDHQVKRLLSSLDGGHNGYPTMRIARPAASAVKASEPPQPAPSAPIDPVPEVQTAEDAVEDDGPKWRPRAKPRASRR